MEIEQQIWGATSEGEAVVLYTLRNAAGAEVRLCNVGAAVVSILVPDRDGHLADVALGYKDFRSYFGDPALCGKSIGRVAGCIAYGTMRIDGEEYRLDINGMAGHLNGGVKGFAGRLWESRVETNRVVMSLFSEDGDQGYPGNLQVEAAFDFDEDNALEITYIARTDRTTPVNMACNLLLNLGGEGSGSVLDHELRLDASTVLEADDRLIPTGKLPRWRILLRLFSVVRTWNRFQRKRTWMSPPADAFCRIIFRDMMAFPVQAAARRGRERRVQSRFSRRETHLLVLFAVVSQQACCNGKGFRTELAVPCYAFTMQESSKMIKRRTRKRTSGFPLFIGAMPCGDMVCGGVSGTARTVGPFCGRENGIRPLCFGKRRVRDAGDLGALPGGGVFFASALL